jgi:hypothetical protein
MKKVQLKWCLEGLLQVIVEENIPKAKQAEKNRMWLTSVQRTFVSVELLPHVEIIDEMNLLREFYPCAKKYSHSPTHAAIMSAPSRILGKLELSMRD